MESHGCITWRQIEPGIFRLRDPFGFQCHLVVGEKRALLIDAMGGHGNLREAVAHLTDLPVDVVATHAHYDHVAGSWFFDELCIHPTDAPHLDFEETLAVRAHARALDLGIVSPEEPWCLRDGSRPRIRPVSEGHEFDLGGLVGRVVELPGHTLGSIGVLFEDPGVLFTGDAVTPSMCLFFDDSTSIEEYRATLAKMLALPFERFYTSHQDRTFMRSDLADFDDCAAFCATDPGSEWVHDVFPEFTGRIHLYRGIDPEADDFLALIEKDTPETRERARRIRAERRAAKRAQRG